MRAKVRADASPLCRQAGTPVERLATIMPRRTSATPDARTLAKAGYPNTSEAAWHGFPRRSSRQLPSINELDKGSGAMLAEPASNAKLAQMGIKIVSSSPQTFSERIASELAWARARSTASASGSPAGVFS